MSNLYIMHYGVGHDKGGHSGRYPWGSGEQPFGETHGKGKKDIWKEDRKVARKNAAKVAVGTALAGPVGTVVAGANTKSSDLRKIGRYNNIGSTYDMESASEIVEDAIIKNTGKDDDDNWDWDTVKLSSDYIKDGLNKYKNLKSDEAIKSFLDEPRNKEIKDAMKMVKKDREDSLKEGIEFVKKMSDIYDLKTLYDIDTNKISPDQKIYVDNAKDFVKKVATNNIPTYDIVSIFNEYYNGLRKGLFGDPDGDY